MFEPFSKHRGLSQIQVEGKSSWSSQNLQGRTGPETSARYQTTFTQERGFILDISLLMYHVPSL